MPPLARDGRITLEIAGSCLYSRKELPVMVMSKLLWEMPVRILDAWGSEPNEA